MGFGISIYPEHAPLERNAAYIAQAGERGFTRIFSCLLSVNKDRAAIAHEFRALHDAAHAAGMEVILDVSPAVFEQLGIGYDDLSFFAEVRADGIRLDEPFTGAQIARMTHNPFGLKIELNASSADGTLDATLANKPDRARLLSCHNFYPQRYTGLSLPFFVEQSRSVRATGTRLAAFVGCTDHAAFGPWPQREGLCTLEDHRDLPLDLQARHLAALGLVDDIIISNCFPTETELDALASVRMGQVGLRPEPARGLSPDEERILYGMAHTVRGDRSDYLVRSTASRVSYTGGGIPARLTRDLHRGDIVIVNDDDARYRGELQVVLRDMPNDGLRNVVATLPARELPLLDCLGSWSRFIVIR